jgi:uncharacterized protein (DUF1810 family)
MVDAGSTTPVTENVQPANSDEGTCSLAFTTAADHKSPMVMGTDDRFDLNRFVQAQEEVYPRALAELKLGRKRSHWMWFIFPQIDGLGYSSTARFYAIKSKDEAKAYLDHPLLGKRLMECAEALLKSEGKSAAEIFGHPDDLKLRSSVTLFASASAADSVFSRVLDHYFGGEPDRRTLELLQQQASI